MRTSLLPLILLVAVAMLSACERRKGYDAIIEESYRVGMGRDEVHKLLGGDAMTTADRPASGWSEADEGEYMARLAAFRFEEENPGKHVQSCEVYWVGRHTSVPMAVGGVYWDYLFFDREEKLLGHYRRFVD